MRLLKGGKVLGPEWRDFFVYRNVLITPEGHRFEAGDLAWWSLLVRRAKAFGELLRAGNRKAESGTDRPVGTVAEGSALGLVSSSTSDPLGHGHSRKQGVSAGQLVAAVPGPLTGLRPARDPAGDSGRRATTGRLARALRAAGGAR